MILGVSSSKILNNYESLGFRVHKSNNVDKLPTSSSPKTRSEDCTSNYNEKFPVYRLYREYLYIYICVCIYIYTKFLLWLYKGYIQVCSDILGCGVYGLYPPIMENQMEKKKEN